MHARSQFARVLLAAFLAAQLPTIAHAQNGQVVSGITDPWCLSPIVLADLNLDGRLDQVGQHFVTGQPVAFRLGLPDGTFAPPVDAGVTCLEPLVGDTTGDGWPDIVMIEVSFVFGQTNRLAVVPSTGSGTFGPPVFTTVDEGLSLFHQPVIADFDSDGRVDVAVLPDSCSCIRVYGGHADGSLAPLAEIDTAPSVSNLRVDDFDGDGLSDLLTLRGNPPRADIAIGHGDGTFSAAVKTNLPLGSTNPSTGDLDEDGRPDVLFAGETFGGTPDIGVYRGQGNGHLEHAATLVVPLAWPPQGHNSLSGAIDDFDRDGLPDIIASAYSWPLADQTHGIWFFRGHGDMVFEAPVWLVGSDAVEFQALADLDGDGQRDLLVRSESVQVVYFGNGPASIEQGEQIAIDAPAVDLATGRIDGDGDLDLAVLSPETTPPVSVLLGDGQSGFVRGPSVPAPPNVQRLWLADISGDGQLDFLLAVDAAGGGLVLLEGLGDGQFIPLATIDAGTVADLVTVDLDGDGVLDILTCDPLSQSVKLLFGIGAGLFAPIQALPSGGDSRAVAAGDVDENGLVDVAVANTAEQTVAVLWDVIAPSGAAPYTWTITQHPRDVLLVDLDRDDHLDLVECGWHETTNSTATKLLPGHGDGSFGVMQVVLPGGHEQRLEVTDLNRDGLLDLLVANAWADDGYPGYTLGLVLGLPTSPWNGTPFSLHTGLNPVATAAGDFDGDQFPDIAVARSGVAAIDILRNRSRSWATLGYGVMPSAVPPPLLSGRGVPIADAPVTLNVSAATVEPGILVVGFESDFHAFGGGMLVPSPDALVPFRPDSALHTRWPKGIPAGTPVYLQALFAPAGGKLLATNALVVIAQ